MDLLQKAKWRFLKGKKEKHPVTGVTYEAYRQLQETPRSIRKSMPCKMHDEAAPTMVEATIMGMDGQQRFLHRCEVCGWLIHG